MAFEDILPKLKSPGEALFEGASKTNDILSSLMKNYLSGQELAQQGKYRKGMLDIEKMKEAREQQEAPLNLQLIREKINALKNKQKSVKEMTELTKPTITANQKLIQSIDNTLPQLNNLIKNKNKIPGQLIGKYTNPSDQAAYEANISQLTDTLVSALNLPKTNESLALAEKMIRESPYESRESYLKRIKNLVTELQGRKKNAISILKSKSIYDTDEESGEDASEGKDEVHYEIKDGKLIKV